ncbi:MAG: hypothetical protein ACFB2W_06080 [Leptolyngbyaceae cyanobacterium]
MNQTRYEILQILGKGQSGQTILAAAPNPVVIKQIYAPKESLDTLTKRLQLVGRHPQLPALIDSWQLSGSQFFVFEHIAAAPLTRAIPWSPTQVESLLRSLLPVLEHIHSFRLAHGDIRPDNIRQGTPPVLVDLRIPQRSATAGGDAAYAAPEQTFGQLVYASDLYSLGLVAIHLLTGLTPFDLYSVADNRWIWPELVADSLPSSLSKVLHKLLERSLENRYTSTAQVISDLQTAPLPAFLDKALSLFPSSLPGALQKVLAPANALSPAAGLDQISWQPLYQLTPGITPALALYGTTLALGTAAGEVLVCNLANEAEIYTLSGRSHRDRITALVFHPQGHTLYSASSDGTVKLWDLTSGSLQKTLSQPGWLPTDLAIALPYLIVSDGSGHITLWDLEQLKPNHRFTQHQDWVSAIAASNGRLASISRDRTLRIWSLSEKRLLETLSVGNSQKLAIHPSGDYIIVGSDQQVDVWQLGRASPEQLCSVSDSITALVLSPDARLLAVGTEGNLLRVYEGASGRCVSELAQGWGVTALAFDGTTLVSSSQDETVTVWQRANPKEPS